MSSFLILAVGQDPMVLNTRCSILQSEGYIVRSASSIAESINLFRGTDFDFVLLCHSISADDRDGLIRSIRFTGSHIPIYIVASVSTVFDIGLADGVLSSTPQDLIKQLGEVLGYARQYNPYRLPPAKNGKSFVRYTGEKQSSY